jgi:hypothetical protein
MIKVVTTPERQAEIDAYWADVRAGIAEANPHVFKEDLEPTISMHRHLASRLVEQAASHAKKAMELSK